MSKPTEADIRATIRTLNSAAIHRRALEKQRPLRGFDGMVVLHLQDEAPKIGSGVHLCTATVGSRWVKLIGGNRRRAKLTREVFDRVFKSIYRIGEPE